LQVVKSGLAPTLSDPNANFTIYAPDAAFKALGFKTVADVTATEASTLRTILLNHAIGDLLQSRQVPLPQQPEAEP
jgi:hypothetical protein